MQIDLSCPVEIRNMKLDTNQETGELSLLFNIQNISKETITSLNLDIKVLDENGVEIKVVPVEFTELTVKPKDFFGEDKPVIISDIENAKNFLADVTYVLFENEESYTPSDENTIDYDDKEASIDDAVLLREFIPNAVCYSSENEDHWKCACGRPNFLDSENCVRCGLSKEVMIENFSSKEKLENAIKMRDEEIQQKALEEERLSLEKRNKLKKNVIKTCIIIAILISLAVVGYFVRYAIVSLQAGSAIKSGDYPKAYELYSSIGSKKRTDITNKAMGNTPSNLLFSTGYLAEDSENIYYITRAYSQPSNLIKENKSTKEKTILTDAAYCNLNVVGEYIYFINADGNPCRMTKDGNTTDILTEDKTPYICVIANDMYYVKTDYDNPKGFTEQECEILAAQGQMDVLTRLYKLNLKTKKSTLVSEENINSCSIYNGRIYYLTTNNVEDTWKMSNLKSMSIDGKNVETLVDSPVTSLFVKDDVLYYISYFNESAKGSEISDLSTLNCTVNSLDLKTGAKNTLTSFEDGIVLDVNVSDNKMIYTCYNREMFINYFNSQGEEATPPTCEMKMYDFETGKTKSILAADVASLNVSKNDIFCILSDGTLARIDLNTLKFTPVYEDGTSTPPLTEEIEE